MTEGHGDEPKQLCKDRALRTLDSVIKEISYSPVRVSSSFDVLEASTKLVRAAWQLRQKHTCVKYSGSIDDSSTIKFDDRNESTKQSWHRLQLFAQFCKNTADILSKALNWAKSLADLSTSNDCVTEFIAHQFERLSFILWQNHALPPNCSVHHNFPPKMKSIDSRNMRNVCNIPKVVKARAAVRVDMAGGWSDTPPFTYQCKDPPAAVLNVAIKTNSEKPIESSCCWLNSPQFEGIYIQLSPFKPSKSGEQLRDQPIIHYKYAQDIFENSDRPSQPGSLICAIVVSSSLVKKYRNGEEISHKFNFKGNGRAVLIQATSKLPHGSGMGTSSILAGTLLACLWRMQGKQFTESDLIQTVLKVEQLHTSGGGWQDQVGGLVPGGFKLGTVCEDSKNERSGKYKQIIWRKIVPTKEFAKAFENTLILVYTGTTRLAKNLLQGVILRWLRGDDDIRKVVKELATDANEAAGILQKGHFPLNQCTHYNELKKVLASNTETPIVSDLRAQLYEVGLSLTSWVAGAGGGGFLYVWLAQDKTVNDVRTFLSSDNKWKGMYVSSVQIDYNPLEIEDVF
ncbi:L-fucose kinase [Ditylenchus destructor]|uniref:L-fucose kinase n=1 Tax=Ditylenchus destructor TaxID=166010 RepID=A0AAD4N204_9BILA|nr:L-fucose kinase [Ditylenchus destructor]